MAFPLFNLVGTIGQTVNTVLGTTSTVPAVPAPTTGSVVPVETAQVTTALGVVASVTSALDAGITVGATSVIVGDTGTLLNLPMGVPILPSLSSSAANSSTPMPSAADGSRFDGDSGNNNIVGTDGHDVALGAGGSDTIHGAGGNDHLYGFGPNGGIDAGDLILGGDGTDYIQGNAGNDTLDGGTGSDRIFGGADNDMILGQAGNDSVNGNFGNDTIDGGDGNDFLRGGKGEDLVHGGAGADIVSGDLGADVLIGGAGADIFRFASADAAVIATDLLIGRLDTIGDFANGEDHLALGFAPTGIAYGSAADLLSATFAYAQTLLGGLGGHGAASIQVGADTYLFYGANNGLVADSVIKLTGVGNAQIDQTDFL